MKLVELLARELNEWPEDAHVAIQDPDQDNTIWFLERNHNNIEFRYGGWTCYGSSFDIMISRPSRRASDYNTAIVGYDEWEDERKRISQPQAEEPKANVFVGKDANIEYAFSQDGVALENLDWKPLGNAKVGDIEFDSVKNEEVEVDKFCAGYKCNATAENIEHSKECLLEAEMSYTGFKIGQIDGPIKWRDTVNELDAYIEEFTREREALINRLALEGFALLPSSSVAGVADIDMSDCRNWRAGDIVECLTDQYAKAYTKGSEYKIQWIKEDSFSVIDNYGDESSCDWFDGEEVDLKFIRRP